MLNIQPVPAIPTQMPSMPMTMPVSTRVSSRIIKGQTSKYDDFAQQIALKPGTYASDGTNLFKLEDIGNTSNMNLHVTYPSWQPNNPQTWSHLDCDGYQQTPWNDDKVHQRYFQYDDMWRFNNKSGYLTNDVYSFYEDYRP